MTDQQEQEQEKPKIYNNFLFRVFAVAITILVLYFVISPYQNCIRTVPNEPWCTRNTSW